MGALVWVAVVFIWGGLIGFAATVDRWFCMRKEKHDTYRRKID